MGELQRHFARQLRLLRLQRGWSQAELAEEVRISQTTISDMESGKRWAKPNILERLMSALGVGVDDLLGRKQDVPRRKGSQDGIGADNTPQSGGGNLQRV